MRDIFLVIELAESVLAASLGFPLAAILGCDPRVGFLAGLAILIVPWIVLGRLASDFTREGKYSPNVAARLLHALEYVRAMAAGIGLLAMLSLPVGILLRLRGRPLALFVLGSGVLFSAVLSGLPAIIMRPEKRKPQ